MCQAIRSPARPLNRAFRFAVSVRSSLPGDYVSMFPFITPRVYMQIRMIPILQTPTLLAR